MKHWKFTLLLGVAYLLIFHLWLILPPKGVVSSGIAAAAFLSFLHWRNWLAGYFLNRWDAFFHAAVILDILLEAVLIRGQHNLGFYWCAGGFGVALAAYRISQFRGLFPQNFTVNKQPASA